MSDDLKFLLVWPGLPLAILILVWAKAKLPVYDQGHSWLAKPFRFVSLRCLFGFHRRHPGNANRHLHYYIHWCGNGDYPWQELCPDCGRWNRCPALDSP